MPILLVRHGSAGRRNRWRRDDRLRPLDAAGRRQAAGLVEGLAGFGPTQILTSPFRRCIQTVEPLGLALGLPIEERDELAEGASVADALRLVALLPDGAPILCTHRALVADLVGWERQRAKGSAWVLEPDGVRIAPTLYIPPAR